MTTRPCKTTNKHINSLKESFTATPPYIGITPTPPFTSFLEEKKMKCKIS